MIKRLEGQFRPYMIFIDILYTKFMDFMLEEELIDLYTFCLQNPDSLEVEQKKVRITEVGKEIFDDGGVDALENFYFTISNRIQGEIEKDIVLFRPLWNGFSDEWKY
jgi:hypothetical protein